MSPAVVEVLSAGEWDALAGRHPRGHLLQSWFWGQLKSEFGWRPLRLAVVERSGALPAGAQLLIRRFAGLSVCYVPRGPLFSGEASADNLLLSTLRKVARRHRAAFLRLEPNLLDGDPHADQLNASLQVAGFRQASPLQPRTSIHLDLAPEPEQLFAA